MTERLNPKPDDIGRPPTPMKLPPKDGELTFTTSEVELIVTSLSAHHGEGWYEFKQIGEPDLIHRQILKKLKRAGCYEPLLDGAKCECHERDSTWVCRICYIDGARGHCQDSLCECGAEEYEECRLDCKKR